MTPQSAVLHLIASGWSEAKIAKEVGTSQPTIHRIKHDRNARGTSFEVGNALIRLADQAGEGNADAA
jgi:transcriptional regulator